MDIQGDHSGGEVVTTGELGRWISCGRSFTSAALSSTTEELLDVFRNIQFTLRLGLISMAERNCWVYLIENISCQFRNLNELFLCG